MASYTNPNDNLAAARITDPIQGAGTAQTYVPGSLQAPPGFTKQWSTDNGATFTTTDPGTATNVVQATNPLLTSPATGLATPLPAPFGTIASTGGDGFTPILFTATINGQPVREAWNIFHHDLAGGPARVVCTDLDTSGPCPAPSGAATTWPKPLNSSTAGGTTGDLNNTFVPTYVLMGSRLLYPGTTDGSTSPARIGVGCIDLQSQSSCGFTQLLSTAGVTTLSGVVLAPNGKVYGAASNGQIVCEDPNTNTPCAGQPYSVGLPTSRIGFANDTTGALDVINGQVYITETADSDGSSRLACLDPSTNGTCTGWSTPRTVATTTGGNTSFLLNVFADRNTAGTETGVCTIVGAITPAVTPAQGTPVCFDFAGSVLAAPPGLQTLVSTNLTGGDTLYSPPETITAANGHVASYFPFWSHAGANNASTTYCWDWTTAAACTGFGSPDGVLDGPPSVNGGNTRPYGYAFDGQCLYGLGDASFLFSFDPGTGAAPCLRTTAITVLNAPAFYCDSQTGHVRSYGTVGLGAIDPSTVNFAESSVTVENSSGTVLGTFPFDPTTRTADISSVPISVSPITVLTHIALINTSSFTPTNQPQVIVTFAGDSPQLCFETTVANDCSVTSISDQASITLGTAAPVSSNTVTLQITPGTACTPTLTVLKQICLSDDAADCGKGGSGPWGKKTTLQRQDDGSECDHHGCDNHGHKLCDRKTCTAYWRITVTNTGGVDITGITLNDRKEASCVAAAGTFDLAAGQSTKFFCSSRITKDTTNKVTASFVPPNSPPGTPPVTTAPSSATAKCPPPCRHDECHKDHRQAADDQPSGNDNTDDKRAPGMDVITTAAWRTPAAPPSPKAL
ncbi:MULTISPECIES: DUF7617 domain-containing protein [Streptomyces]|uniref:DUF7617 domain-containing protein n=1 Tax=Streptomyces TaxID=1883 RepID=UPI00068ED967|nr:MULTISPECIES: hypothetical protein [Streptomyces]